MKLRQFKVFLIISLLLSVFLVGCEKADDRVIDEIYIHQFAYDGGSKTTIYKLDLQNKEFLKHEVEMFTSFTGPLQEVDYILVRELKDDGIEKFRADAQKNSFTKWEEHYEIDADDGSGWEMIVVFSNGDIMKSTGSNAYPKTWDNMKDAFKDLVGEDILYGSH